MITETTCSCVCSHDHSAHPFAMLLIWHIFHFPSHNGIPRSSSERYTLTRDSWPTNVNQTWINTPALNWQIKWTSEALHLETGPFQSPPARWHNSRQLQTEGRADPASSLHSWKVPPCWCRNWTRCTHKTSGKWRTVWCIIIIIITNKCKSNFRCSSSPDGMQGSNVRGHHRPCVSSVQHKCKMLPCDRSHD